jgi:hypothetical protein
MSNPEPRVSVKVDATNPGQFFACRGLLELAGRKLEVQARCAIAQASTKWTTSPWLRRSTGIRMVGLAEFWPFPALARGFP